MSNWIKPITTKKLSFSDVAEKTEKAIDKIKVNKKEYLLAFLALWSLFLFCVFSVIAVVRLAFFIF